MSKYDEQILVAPTESLFNAIPHFQGSIDDTDSITKLIMAYDDHHTYKRRGDMEEDPSYKQLIPYIALNRGNEFFVYKRLTGGGEERLHGSYSLGVGGHMNEPEEKKSFLTTVKDNALRELHEELSIEMNSEEQINTEIIGLINDDENEVGRVHLGLLMSVEVPETAKVEVAEKDVLEGVWMTKEQLKECYNQFEEWSKITIDLLLKAE